jgi:alanyl aminopeptidase
MPVWRLPSVIACVLALAGSAGAATTKDPVRLVAHPVEPLAEALELRLDPAAEGYTGRAIVDLAVHAPTREIRLHAREFELGTILLQPRAGGAAVPTTVTRGDVGLLTLATAVDIAPGAWRLEIAFSAKYQGDGVGLYKTEFEGAPYLFTQFEARFGRIAFPCWDEPGFKFPWQVTLIVPESQRAFSNTEVVVETAADGWRTLQFARTPPMPTYLVAFAVGPFETVPVEGMAVPGRIITARGQSGLAGAVARETPKILATLEDYFGIPYPYGKLDQIAVPEFTWGGMENVGLITYRDSTILRPPGDTDQSRRRGMVQILAHEIAHHWYGDLVTMEWWNDLWLNESFASWMEGKVLDAAYPELRYGLNAIGGKQRAMRIDALPSTGPVRREISASDDPEKYVDTLSYEKGEAVLTMIEAWIGPEKFRAAMKRYFQKHKWGSTRAEDLWAAFGEVSGDDVTAMVAGFIEQPGVPQVSIEVLPGDRLRLQQRRYVALGGTLAPGAERVSWQVPMVVKYATASGVKTARVLLREREQVVDLPGISTAAWVFPNAGETGYYRWQLDAARDAALAQRGLQALAPIERLGVLFNAAAMHEAGDLAPSRYLSLLVDFTRDPVPDVARRAVEAILRVRSTYLADADEEAFAQFCRTALRPALDRIGLEPRKGEEPEIAALRRELIGALGVRGGDAEVIAWSGKLTAQLLKDPRSVDTGVASAALSVAVWHGDAPLFEACEQAFRSAKVPTDRAMFLEALGGFRDLALSARALTLSLGSGFRSHERLDVAMSMTGGSMAHRRLVVEWMMANFDEIRAKAGEHTVNYLVVLAEGPDAALFAQARDFLRAPGRINDAAEKNIAEACDRDAQRQALRARGRAEVLGFVAGAPASPAPVAKS